MKRPECGDLISLGGDSLVFQLRSDSLMHDGDVIRKDDVVIFIKEAMIDGDAHEVIFKGRLVYTKLIFSFDEIILRYSDIE